MKLLSAFNRLSKRKKIQVSLFVIVAVILIAFAVWRVVGLFAEEVIITNQATITYDDGSGSQTVTSNSVQTQVVPVSEDVTVNFNLNIQGRSDHSVTGISFKILPVGGTTPVFEVSNASTDATGSGQVLVTGLSSGNYDYRIRVPKFLSSTISNQPLVDLMTLDFGTMLGGDLNDDNIVNSLDFSIMMGDWGGSGPSDINGDGKVNTIDFSLLNSNWFISGD